MDKILYINACTRKCSRTDELTRCLLGALEGETEELSLYKTELYGLDEKAIEERDALIEQGRTDAEQLRLARQFAAADTIVISAPYWNLLFPAVLGTYIESICACSVTFRYSQKGIPESLCKAKRLYYVTTSGGYIGDKNFGFEYISALARSFFGIKDVQCFAAQGLDIQGNDERELMEKAKAQMLSCLENN